MTWRRSLDGWVSSDGRWRIRGPIMGQRMYWLYWDGTRYTPTGRYADSVHFTSVQGARAFVRRVEGQGC